VSCASRVADLGLLLLPKTLLLWARPVHSVPALSLAAIRRERLFVYELTLLGKTLLDVGVVALVVSGWWEGWLALGDVVMVVRRWWLVG
jgi:hypothetical protein